MRVDARQRWAWALAALLLTALIILAARRLDATRLFAELASLHTVWIAVASVCYLAILPLWALQWRLLAPDVERNRFRPMLDVVTLTSSTHNTTAFMVGEATSVILLVTQIGLARSAALSVLAMDQLLVGVAKLAVLTTAALAVTLPAWMNEGMAAVGVGVILLFGACVLVAARFEAIAAHLAPLKSVRRGGGALTLAFCKKLVEIAAIVCVQHAFGISLPLSSAVVVLGARNIATLVPIVPGNLGVFEGAVAVTYTWLGVPAEQAVGMGIVSHACYLAALALPGYVVVARSAVRGS